MLTLFISRPGSVDERTLAFLRALVEETSMGLESIWLRRRELTAIRQIQSIRRKTDLKNLLSDSLENIHSALDLDIVALTIYQPAMNDLITETEQFRLTIGGISPPMERHIEGIFNGVIASKEPVVLNDMAEEDGSTMEDLSLICVPLISSNGDVKGAVLAGKQEAHHFNQRHLALLQTISGQITLVVHNADLIADIEYQSMMQERRRLAREIHDGLAQTLGFLKLQAAQMRNHILRGDLERAQLGVDNYYETLSDAYQDARWAIDGLRTSPHESGVIGWLKQTIEDFKEVSGISVMIDEGDLQTELPSEIQAQLIRIVQEALSNVRKHALAERVWVAFQETKEDIILEIRDDGVGFTPDDVTRSTRYGLLGMRERAELLGGEIQVISNTGQGTILRLRLPLNELREMIK